MGLIQQVKHYEHLTIEAAIEQSYQKALLALTIHPLVRDYSKAKSILDEYITQHHNYFPVLK
jgi:6-phospho-beta-glucosidase